MDFISTTPSPNLGNCDNTSAWDDDNMVTECKNCVSQEPEYGKPWFYCDGSCLNQYELNGSCDENSLVAKNVQQCEAPCFQVAAPPVCGNCSDNFDCPANQECKIKDIKADGMTQKNCGVCTPSSTPDNPSPTPDNPSPTPDNTSADNTGSKSSDTKNTLIIVFTITIVVILLFILFIYLIGKNKL